MSKQFEKANNQEQELSKINPRKVNIPKPIELTPEQDENLLDLAIKAKDEEEIEQIRKELKMSFLKLDDDQQKNIESEVMREQPRADLLDIYESRENRDVSKLSKILIQAKSELLIIENKIGKEKVQDNLNWILDNNNRIDLYQITAVLNKKLYGRTEDEMDESKAKQLLAYRKIQAVLLTASEIGTEESVEFLSNFIEENLSIPYLYNTAIDALAKNPAENAKIELLKFVDNDGYSHELRTKAVLSGLRAGLEFDSQEIFNLIEEYIESLGDNLCQDTGTYNIIEITGLLKDTDGSAELLDKLYEKMRLSPEDKRQWFERDIISTRLTIKSDDKEKYLKDNLQDRHYVNKNGIVFGSINPELDFNEFLLNHSEKFDKIAEMLAKINDAFGSEPIMYVDISPGDANEAGWTQNSIYFSADYILHSDDIDDLLQSTGHEACERWHSKGFVDVDLAKFYIQLMGNNYPDSELDKFRLKHREKAETNSGHPWDGEREFLAELGSTLLVNPSYIDKLFDPKNDKISLEALSYLKKKLFDFKI